MTTAAAATDGYQEPAAALRDLCYACMAAHAPPLAVLVALDGARLGAAWHASRNVRLVFTLAAAGGATPADVSAGVAALVATVAEFDPVLAVQLLPGSRGVAVGPPPIRSGCGCACGRRAPDQDEDCSRTESFDRPVRWDEVRRRATLARRAADVVLERIATSDVRGGGLWVSDMLSDLARAVGWVAPPGQRHATAYATHDRLLAVFRARVPPPRLAAVVAYACGRRSA